MAAHRDRAKLPAELVTEDRWVRRDGKRPITPVGRAASSTNPLTWSSLADVEAGKAGDGIGFVLNGDGIACIDIDHCVRPDGSLEPWAARFLRRVPETWIEVSPSGTGLHVWGIATVGAGRMLKRPDGGSIEVYDRGRYITVTRRPFGHCPRTLADLSGVVDALLDQEVTPCPDRPRSAAVNGVAATRTPARPMS
ncbi:hypothetical protein [Cellulomonas sp. NPDC058312]|uniref:hypothetical protein n=1 Tax=Cellulomonas sp. NPDC058312 TaxID=3346441 RepID=UPI0036E45C80